MDGNKKISGLQLGLLIIGFTIGSSTILFPGTKSGTDIWIVTILGFLGGLILLVMYSYIFIINQGKTFNEILDSCFGKVIGKIILGLYLWYFLHLLSIVLRNFMEFLSATIYIETPILFIAICLMLVEVYVVRKGLDAIGRVNVFLVPTIFVTTIIIVISLIKEYNLNNLLPLLENGVKPLIKPTFGIMSFPYGELVVFLMIFPYFNNRKKTLKVTVISASIATIFLLLMLVRNLMVLGPALMERSLYPSYLAVKLTPGVDIEVLIVANLLIGGGVKLSVLLISIAIGIKNLFKFNNHKPFVVPISAIAIAMSLWIYENYFEMARWAEQVYPYYAMPFQIIIPLIILIISVFKNIKVTVVNE